MEYIHEKKAQKGKKMKQNSEFIHTSREKDQFVYKFFSNIC